MQRIGQVAAKQPLVSPKKASVGGKGRTSVFSPRPKLALIPIKEFSHQNSSVGATSIQPFRGFSNVSDNISPLNDNTSPLVITQEQKEKFEPEVLKKGTFC